MSPDNTYKDMAVENAGRISFCAVDFKFATDDAVKQWFQEGGLSKWVVPDALPTSRFAYEVAWRVVSFNFNSSCRAHLERLQICTNHFFNRLILKATLKDPKVVAVFSHRLLICFYKKFRDCCWAAPGMCLKDFCCRKAWWTRLIKHHQVML